MRKLKDHWNQRGARPKSYAQKRNWSASVGAQEVLDRVSEHFESNPEALKNAAHAITSPVAARLRCAGIMLV